MSHQEKQAAIRKKSELYDGVSFNCVLNKNNLIKQSYNNNLESFFSEMKINRKMLERRQFNSRREFRDMKYNKEAQSFWFLVWRFAWQAHVNNIGQESRGKGRRAPSANSCESSARCVTQVSAVHCTAQTWTCQRCCCSAWRR